MSLGLQIMVRRVSLDASSAEYTYNTRGNAHGLVRVDRTTGEVILVRAAPDDGEGLLFSRVAFKLKKHWHEGDLPERTHWAS